MQLKPVKLTLMLAVAVAGLLAVTAETSADWGGRSRHHSSYTRYSSGYAPVYYAPRSSYYSYRSSSDCGDRYYAPRSSSYGFSFGYSSGRSYYSDRDSRYNDCRPRYSDCSPRYYSRSHYSRRGCR
jgi:hypothetical protein